MLEKSNKELLLVVHGSCLLILLLSLLLLTLPELCVQLVSQGKGDLAEQSSKSVYPVTTAMDINSNYAITTMSIHIYHKKRMYASIHIASLSVKSILKAIYMLKILQQHNSWYQKLVKSADLSECSKNKM